MTVLRPGLLVRHMGLGKTTSGRGDLHVLRSAVVFRVEIGPPPSAVRTECG